MKSASASISRRLVFTGKQEVHLEDFSLLKPGLGQIRVRIEFSLMSTGTENIVFNRLFDPGTHWDKWVRYPFYPGYSAVGAVEEVGKGVANIEVGMRVACRCGHQSHAMVAGDDCFPILGGIPSDAAVWFALAKIAFHGALAADYRLGDSVLVIGAGPIGQMSVRWARASGAKTIIAVDPIEGRLGLAGRGGATAVSSSPVAEAREAILKANGGKLPRVVIDSTGNAKVFAAALGLAADFGSVVILGDTGQPSQQFLTGDVITRGLRIAGAHDCHNTAQWNGFTISNLFFSLSENGRFSLDGLNSHTFVPRDCAKAYEIANQDRASTMGILFKWV
jgi:2-desacetyl-2-hydroxyethyl bacteriochlorophyllide A dehydrogenase